MQVAAGQSQGFVTDFSVITQAGGTMETLDAIVGKVGAFAWGPPMLILLVGTGFWLTFALRGLQFTKLGHALYLALIKRKEDGDEPGDISHFQALTAALLAN